MSIEVKDIVKTYGEQVALNHCSFSISKGEIVGFLGPNGAGKSTMMKILTGFIAPTSGTALVDGTNVVEDPMAVKSTVGYLPEHNPLYLEMYVREYLDYVARVFKVMDKKQAVARVIDQVGLQRESHKQIGALSKGYRQRVGLAQVLVHDPQVLILDEPTTGLDPIQIVEIRELIADIGKSRTVLMSTHIMQEVEAICSRVIILDRGKIKADGSIAQLQGQQEVSVYVVEYSGKLPEAAFVKLSGVKRATSHDGTTWVVEVEAEVDIRSDLFQLAVSNDLSLLAMRQEVQDLEEVFKRLTEN